MTAHDLWYSACDSALARSMYGGRLHIASISPADDGESLRLAFKPDEHAPWAIEYFVRPWRGRAPESDDIDSIVRQINNDAAGWFEKKSRLSARRRRG